MLFLDDSYEPDEILMDIDSISETNDISTDMQELDFESQAIIKECVYDFLTNSEIQEALFN